MEVVSFKREHLKLIELQHNQANCQKILDNWQDVATYENSDSYTLLDNGKAIIICGLFKIWEHRYVGWTFISKDAGKYFTFITREIKKFLEENAHIQRIECYVDSEFKAGHRWAKLLGFKHEGRLRKYQYGRDADLYARIN